MARMIFVNLPVADLPRAMAFYKALGFTNNPAFSDAAGACMVLSEAIYVMLLTHAKWQGFTTRPICPAGSSEVSLALNCDDKAETVIIVNPTITTKTNTTRGNGWANWDDAIVTNVAPGVAHSIHLDVYRLVPGNAAGVTTSMRWTT